MGKTVFVDLTHPFSAEIPRWPYFDKPVIQNGRYPRDRFYYTLHPFTIRNMENFVTDSVKFNGVLTSAGIFPDITEPHNLRTRRIGTRIAIEAHIRMNGDITLSEAHDHATQVEQKLKKRFGNDTHVTIHMEPVKNK